MPGLATYLFSQRGALREAVRGGGASRAAVEARFGGGREEYVAAVRRGMAVAIADAMPYVTTMAW